MKQQLVNRNLDKHSASTATLLKISITTLHHSSQLRT